MNFDTAAKIGLGLLKHQDEIGKLLGGAGKLLGGEGAGKLADRFAGALAKKLDRLEAGAPPDGLNTLQALRGFAYFDADRNGQLTRDELAAGLQKLEAAGLATPQNQQMHALGNRLLAQYDQAAALDGDHQTVSYLDIGTLAARDGRSMFLSDADWAKLQT